MNAKHMIAQNTSFPTIERRPEFAGLLKENQKFATGQSDGAGEAINGWFYKLMVQSCIRTAPAVWLGLSLVCGMATGGLLYVITERPFVTAVAAIIGLMTPVVVAMVLRSRRQQQRQ